MKNGKVITWRNKSSKGLWKPPPPPKPSLCWFIKLSWPTYISISNWIKWNRINSQYTTLPQPLTYFFLSNIYVNFRSVFPNHYETNVLYLCPYYQLLLIYKLQSPVHKTNYISYYLSKYKMFNKSKRNFLRYETWSYCWRFSSSFKTYSLIK
jgi:hypothetical protein